MLNTVVAPPVTSPFILNFNRINNLWYEQSYYLEKKYPSFEPLGIFNFFVTSFIFILLLFTLFVHLCNSLLLQVTSTCNTCITTSGWAESLENYFSILIILPDLDCGNIFRSALRYRKAVHSIFRHFDIPTLRYSGTSIFRHLVIPKFVLPEEYRNNETSIFRNPVSFFLRFGSPTLSLGFNIPTVPCSDSSFFRQFSIPNYDLPYCPANTPPKWTIFGRS